MTLQLNQLVGFGGGTSGGFTAAAVTFDGSNDYMRRGADLTGNADGKNGIISFWIKYNGGDGGNQVPFWSHSTPHNLIRRDSANKYDFTFRSSGVSNVVYMYTSSTYTVSTGWHHVLAAWDLANTTVQMYIDGSAVSFDATTAINSDIDYTQSDHNFFADNSAGQKVNADVSEFYMNFAEYLDISDAANRAKFRDSDGKPVDLGSDGSTPTGTAPIVYCSVREGDAASVFGTNKGSGGGLTITGSLALAATSPSDD
jgi:hypothetical protein